MLDQVALGAAGVALEGAPGIGKTTLWSEAVHSARRRGYKVISTVPSAPDRALVFAGLGDLFDGLDDELIDGLPDLPRRALRGALLLDDVSDSAVDASAVPRASLTVIRRLAEQGPLVVAIDDEQWLDPASARALAFALCRLREERVGVLLARRPADDAQLWPELCHGFAGRGLEAWVIEPLDVEAIHALLVEQLGRSLSRPLTRRVYDASGGNPLYALAIARELEIGSPSGAGERDLPIPASLADALANRLGRVDRRAGDALLAVAAAARPSVALLQAVIPDFSLGNLDDPIRDGVIELAGARVRFSHPLLASTHYTRSPAARRREIHRALAEVVDDEEERAYHVARGADAPNRHLALVIEQAAGSAARRGAPQAAAALLEDAARLTPADAIEACHSRTIAAADQYTMCGNVRRSRQLLEELLPELPRGPVRARALRALAFVRTDDLELGVALLQEALSDAGEHQRLRSEIELDLYGQLSNLGNIEASVAYISAALESAERAGDPVWLAAVLGEQAEFDAFTNGRGIDRAALRRVLEFEDLIEQLPEDPNLSRPTFTLGKTLFHYDDFDDARPALERAARRADDRGDEGSFAVCQFHLMMLEWFAGNRDVARRHWTIVDRVVRDQGMSNLDEWLAWAHANFALGAGDLEDSRGKATEAVEMAYANGDVLIAAMGEPLLASAELWLGDPVAAHERLQRVREPLLASGLAFLGSLTLGLWSVDIEALIASQRADEAQPVLDDLLARAHRSENPNALAIANRCRGLLHAARGDIPAAIEAMHEALAAHAQRPLAPEVARTHLEQGTLQRRAKQKNAAKQSLEQALAIFEAMGAAMWIARARDELGRIGLRRPVASEGLTPAQQRVAELVASGMSNREIATTLYMSLRSVESHLTKIYRELGIKSRAQLVAAMTANTNNTTTTDENPPAPDVTSASYTRNPRYQSSTRR